VTYFHYYATTSRNIDRVLQYGIYPLATIAGFALARNIPGPEQERFARNFGRYVSALAYGSLTTAFFGFESEMIDSNARKAVATEMGVDPEKLSFSDYGKSDNAIIKRAYNDILMLQKYRLGTDALFLLPTAVQGVSKKLGKEWPESFKAVKNHPEKHGLLDIFFSRESTWEFGVFAGKALYWAGETYVMSKSGHYEVVKLIENLESTGKDMSSNDILAVYQRTRTDNNKPMVETKEEYDALRPLLQRVADTYNERDKKMDIPEIVYLIGMNKINIHAEDGKTVSQEAVQKSHEMIDKVLSIGLDGIREENRQTRLQQGKGEIPDALANKSFTDRLADGAFKATQGLVSAFKPRNSLRKHEEYISVRDPGELTGFNYSINR
jgi:hypothetical protein